MKRYLFREIDYIAKAKISDLGRYQIIPTFHAPPTMHMDSIFNFLCLGKRKISQEFRDYFTSGIERENEDNFPVSYVELVDTFLDFSKIGVSYLYSLPEEKFNELPENNDNKNAETISELI